MLWAGSSSFCSCCVGWLCSPHGHIGTQRRTTLTRRFAFFWFCFDPKGFSSICFTKAATSGSERGRKQATSLHAGFRCFGGLTNERVEKVAAPHFSEGSGFACKASLRRMAKPSKYENQTVSSVLTHRRRIARRAREVTLGCVVKAGMKSRSCGPLIIPRFFDSLKRAAPQGAARSCCCMMRFAWAFNRRP